MKKYFFILFICLQAICQAQLSDSLHNIFKEKRRIDFSYNSKNAFINHSLVSVQNIKLGINFNDKLALGLSYSWLTTKIIDTKTIHDNTLNTDVAIQRKLSFAYIGVYAEYTYYTSHRWEFSIPMQFGVGKVGYNYVYNNKKISEDQGYCFVYEPEVDVKFKVFRWIGLEADVGYRILLKNDPLVKKTFNSPILSLGVFICWDELALLIFKKNKWVQNKFGPSDWK